MKVWLLGVILCDMSMALGGCFLGQHIVSMFFPSQKDWLIFIEGRRVLYKIKCVWASRMIRAVRNSTQSRQISYASSSF